MKTILVCTLGRTPQVLVETVWALANQKDPIVPDSVVAVSMENYAKDVTASLFGKEGGWNFLMKHLRRMKVPFAGKLCFTQVTVPTDYEGAIHDLRTSHDNMRCADYLFRLIKQYADEAQDNVQVILSLSGGRKSLSALAAVVMSLLARPQDRLVHLIADSSLEDGGYHFPRNADGYSLFEVPFIRTRGLLKGVDVSEIDTFEACREFTQEQLSGVQTFPLITLDAKNAAFTVARHESKAVLAIDGSRFMFLWLLFKMKSLDTDKFIGLMCKAHNLNIVNIGRPPGWFRSFQSKKDKFLDTKPKDSMRDFRKVKHETMRDVMKRSGLTEKQAEALYPRMKNGKPIPFEYGIAYPSDRLQVIDTGFTRRLEQVLLRDSNA